MEINEVKVKLLNKKESRLKAFCSITIDKEFVVRDIKVIEGRGGYFVAMPSRKMTDYCEKCGGKNHLRAKFCNDCGANLQEKRVKRDLKDNLKLHVDIAHPIHMDCRKRIQNMVVKAFLQELEKSKVPGYKSMDINEPEGEIPEIIS